MKPLIGDQQQSNVETPAAQVDALHNDGWQVFFGEASDTACRVYATHASGGAPAGVSPIEGTIRGPNCKYAHTLPTTVVFRDRSSPELPLAEAWVPDPCFWTPAMPHCYRYELRLAGTSAQVSGVLGIRRLGACGPNLLFDLKGWVLRAAKLADPNLAQLPAWHEASLAAVVDLPSEELCAAASQIGVLLVAVVPSGCDVVTELRRLSRWPAVGLAVVDALPADTSARELARNLLLVQRVPDSADFQPAAWANALLCPAEQLTGIAGRHALPLLAARDCGAVAAPSDLRTECDRLQRDLAPQQLPLTGFVV